MSYKEWKISSVNKESAKALAEEYALDPFLTLLCMSRGITDPDEIIEFLSDEPTFFDPYELKDMDKAVEIIKSAEENGDLIAVYGDYDCDGITSVALLYEYFTSKNIDAIYRIPDRNKDGYGINISAIDELNSLGVKTIITVDNGISAIEETEYAKKLGMTVVITDHHIPTETLPNADAVVDPHQKDDFSSFKEFCGAGIAFKLICALEDKWPEELISKYGDLVAIGTIGDVMPLISENRSIVKAGLLVIKKGQRVGIEKLLQLSGVDKSTLTSGKISFSLVPRLNAAGRMGSAERAFKLLVSKDETFAYNMAKEIDEDNILRQTSEKEIVKEAVKIIEENGYCYDRIIVVDADNWHKGIIGIVAARICEKYSKPTIVLSKSDGIAVGSGRSYKGFSLYNAILNSSEYLIKFGGHELAAGVTLQEINIDLFRNAINDYAKTLEYSFPQISVDCKINPAAINTDTALAIKVFEPYGHGNSAPVFAVCGAVIEKITSIGGGKHIKLFLTKSGVSFSAVMFGKTEFTFPFFVGDTVDVAFLLDINDYNGKEYLSVQIKDIRTSNTNDEKVKEDLRLFDDCNNGEVKNALAVLPSREDFIPVYKFILSRKCNEETIINKFSSLLGIAKTKIIIEALVQTGVFKADENGLFSVDSKNKVDLNSAQIIKTISGGGNKND